MGIIEIGRLLRASSTGFIVGCKVSQVNTPEFGALVRAPLENDYQVFGLISDIRIADDGLVKQLVTSESVSEEVIADNRINRNVPVEISVLAVGYQQGSRISHLLPPRPPLSLDMIYLSTPEELCAFTSNGYFGYFRHVLRAADLPAGEILAAHLRLAQQAHQLAGNPTWIESATRELITLLRDDYPALMQVLGAISELYPASQTGSQPTGWNS
jgi:hypothetical protein